MSVLITGGAGFIGSNFILDWALRSREKIINLDKLTYAANPANLAGLKDIASYELIPGDLSNRDLVHDILTRFKVRAVVNFAAESHVDRSIHGPADFIQTNIMGTFQCLEAVRAYYSDLEGPVRADFRFLHVSTDEVYGTLAPEDPAFTEKHPYKPNSPYSASKASSDHLVRAYHHTYGLPVLTTNCSNNYGPYQFPEKLIPLMIINAIEGRDLPVYGDGRQVRDWLYVTDHCAAIHLVLEKGRVGETYNIGGDQEKNNLEVVHTICGLLDDMQPKKGGGSYRNQIIHVKDRPGHDRRYAINSAKIQIELGWRPSRDFDAGIRETVTWYLENPDWVAQVKSGEYQSWMERHYKP